MSGRLAGVLFAIATTLRADTIGTVTVSKPFFNPSLGQHIAITFAPTAPGELTAVILDRDGYPVRTLLTRRPITAGHFSLDWDGRDDHNTVVPDEAYSLKLSLTTGGSTSSYFPAQAPAKHFSVTQGIYDRRSAVFSYRLPAAARIHIQAGTATLDQSGMAHGPVLKTLVNREPRPAGAVIETWNGMDENGNAYVPDLPHFMTAIAGTTLPENALITIGNRATAFVAHAATRTGTSLLAPARPGHEHHAGLTTLQDVAPSLHTTVRQATWSAIERVWQPHNNHLPVTYALEGPSATTFAQEPAELFVFIDRRKVRTIKAPTPGTLTIPLQGLTPGTHLLALNWTSKYGPVAVSTLRFRTGPAPSVRTAAH
ncbi:MAG: hypothetical protein M3167_00335 [Acidobacteriota bacterium]|nr:hypothetical protein [Acidobacteriota bacterium]